VHSAKVTDGTVAVRTPGSAVIDGLITLRQMVGRPAGSRVTPYLLVLPALVLVLVLIAGVVSLTWSSLHTYDTFLGTSGKFSFTQYRQAVQDPQFGGVLVRTVLMAAITAVVTVLLSVPFTMVLGRIRSRGWRLVLLIAMFTPFLTGDVTRTFGWIVALGPHGPIHGLLHLLGLSSPTLLGTDWAIGIGIVQVTVPIVVVVLLPAVLKLDPELEAAAMTLGAPRRRVFASVILPQLRAAGFAALAIAFALSMSSYADPLILGEGRNDFLANLLQDRYLNLGDAPLGAAIGVILLILVVVGFGATMVLGRLRIGRRGI
jgi:putative spermidine/putrescine transport system permease protein